MNDVISRFGFTSMPFTREIRSQDFFTLDIFEQEIQALCEVVANRMSGLLVAPAGTGKTVLLRAVKERLPEARFDVQYLKVTGLSKRDLCKEISIAIGARTARYYAELMRSVQERMLQCVDSDGCRPVLIIDEAHDMRPSALGMLRLLTNFDMDSRLVVSVILAGQTPLSRMLQSAELDDVAKRIAHRAELRLLSRDESKLYLKHRLRVAGSSSCPFDAGALEALYELSRGNMRALDELARKSLDFACKEACDVVGQNLVLAAKEKLCI